jgi:uncharacterized protein YjiS (DUF1127 family)
MWSIFQLFDAFRNWRARQRTYACLRELDTRTLKDIGVYRSEIGSIILEADNGRHRDGKS